MSDTQTSKTEPSLEQAINRLLTKLETMDPTTDDYSKTADQLEKLYKMRTHKKANTLSMDSLVAAGASIAGIVLILSYEHAHVVTSKALGFVFKVKI